MLSFHPIRNLCLISVALFFLSACAGDSEEPQLDISVFLSNSSEFLDVGQFQAAIIESRNAIQICSRRCSRTYFAGGGLY